MANGILVGIAGKKTEIGVVKDTGFFDRDRC